uniref:WD repeat domain 60 n=2 Tax=Iconisemion striatum TaxID=60296 RepID=A0A1A7XWG4_9TELE
MYKRIRSFLEIKSFLRAKNNKRMHREKKITKEDTWRPTDLRRHITEKAYDDGYARRRDDSERRHRGGESTERRHKDPEEPRRDRDKHRERKDGDNRDRHAERRKEGSQDRRGDKDRKDREDRRDYKDGERKRLVDDDRGNRERRHDKDETHDKERHRDRHKDKEKEKGRDRERHSEEDTDKERRREEHRRERRRHEESGKERLDETEKMQREQRDRRHREDYEDKRREGNTQERHRDRKHSEQKEGREHKEHRRHEEERDRRHKERGHHGEKQEHKSWEQQDMKTSAEGFSPYQGVKDRRDRDKHKERRERKKEEEDADRRDKDRRRREEDMERNLREKTDSKMKSSDKSCRNEKEIKEVRVASEQQTADVKDEEEAEEPVDLQEDLAEQEYEDDFEDYEDDFEEADESADEGGEEQVELAAQRKQEIEEIQRAVAEENERVGTSLHRPTRSREEEDQPRWSKSAASSDFEKKQIKASNHGKFINFVAARQREVSKEVATKQNKRGAELLRLIDLDYSTTFSLLDLPPVTEYEMYIRHFGNANSKQEYTQCNEDNPDRDVQTEEIDTCEKWTQHPPEHTGACGDPNSFQEARDKTSSELCFDSHCLTSFLQSASQVMVMLLEEDEAERKSLRKLKTQTESLSFSDGSLQLNTSLPFLFGRHISLVNFSQVQRHTMLSVHTPTGKASAVRLDSNTIICIWNIWEPSRPQKILLYESEVQCCCFSPGKSTLVFAGTSVGSVVLWDLRERASNHYRLKIGEEDWTFRQPTFSTDAVMSGSGHLSSVTSVEVVPFTVAGRLSSEVPLLASEEDLSGLSFQLASLDQSGVLNFWVVLELPKANEAGSPTDLGLRPGGKVKLLHSSSLLAADRTSSRDSVKTRPFQTLLLKFLPTDSNHFFIGTDLGLVSHGTSHGLKALPKFYMFQEVEERPVEISSIHFSPFKLHLFLVGCDDGSIRLHTVSRDRPVAEWRSSTAGEALVSLQWSQTRPTVFCVLDAASTLYIWDLLKSDAEPVITERLKADRVTAMSVFGDSGQQTYSGVALAHQSGKIELHYFTKAFTASSSADEGKLETLMTEAF